MVYLVLAVLSTFGVAVLLKVSELKGAPSSVVIASNYVVGAILGWAFVLWDGRLGSNTGVSAMTLALGVGGGLLWPGTLYILTWGIRHFGVALVGSVARLALVVPVLFAWFFLRELLTWQSAVGVAAAFVALYCLSPLQRGHLQAVNRQALWYFPLLVLAMGTVELWANLFHTFGQADENFLFLTFIFTFAMIFSWLAIWRRRRPLDKAAVRRGFVLGVPNFFATFFLLESLRSPLFADHSAVVYSVYSVTGVVLVFAAGALVWREPVTYRSVLGVLVAVGAIILLNNF